MSSKAEMFLIAMSFSVCLLMITLQEKRITKFDVAAGFKWTF